MHDMTYILEMTLMLSLLSIVTRMLPFMMARFLKRSEVIGTLGRYLPAYIMMLLVVFELHIPQFRYAPYGIPAIVGLGVLVVIHCWRRNMMLSILISTSIYLGLLYGL